MKFLRNLAALRVFLSIVVGLTLFACSTSVAFSGNKSDCAIDGVPEYGPELRKVCEDGLQTGEAPVSVRLLYSSFGESGSGIVLIFQKAGGISDVDPSLPLIAQQQRGEVAVLQIDIEALPYKVMPREATYEIASPSGDVRCTLRKGSFQFEC